jgi:signal transduction histidine kinase
MPRDGSIKSSLTKMVVAAAVAPLVVAAFAVVAMAASGGETIGIAAVVIIALACSASVLASGTQRVGALRTRFERATRLADEAATVRLPQALEAARDGRSVGGDLTPLVPDEQDELGDLIAALDRAERTAITLAAEQARVRRHASEMFVDLGRRHQSLLGRTLSLVAELEAKERDPATVTDLLRLDHLVTRLRRNAESLLVLAGSEPGRGWSSALGIDDVVRTALSEIEAYERVDISVLEGGHVVGRGVGAVAHMLAELLENATMFSPPESRVTVNGARRPDGYVVSVTDRGIGLKPADLSLANERLTRFRTVEFAPPRQLGLAVVAELARRHGVVVQLSETPGGGTTASMLLPPILLAAAPNAAEFVPTSRPVAAVTEPAPPVVPALPIALVAPVAPVVPAAQPVPPAPAPAPVPVPQAAPEPAPALRVDAWPVPPPPIPKPVPTVEPAPQLAPEPERVIDLTRIEAEERAAHPATFTTGPATAAEPFGSALPQRTRGEQLPDLGPGRPDEEQAPARDAAGVRAQLAGLQEGIERARTDVDEAPGGPVDSVDAPAHDAAEAYVARQPEAVPARPTLVPPPEMSASPSYPFTVVDGGSATSPLAATDEPSLAAAREPFIGSGSAPERTGFSDSYDVAAVAARDALAPSADANEIDEIDEVERDDEHDAATGARVLDLTRAADDTGSEWAHDDPDATTPLARRVAGANLPDTGPPRDPSALAPSRTPEEVRSALTSFQHGTSRGALEHHDWRNGDDAS